MLMLITATNQERALSHHFNTSHVNVNLNRYAELDKPFTDFNTSHVNVNPTNLSLFNHA